MNSVFKESLDLALIKAAWKQIAAVSKITVLGHKDPDRDTAFGSLAVAQLLCEQGKEVTVIFPNRSNFKLPATDAKLLYGKHQQLPELIIVVDAAAINRVYFPPEFVGIPLINIDHHLDNSVNGNFNFVDVTACSACEVAARLIYQWDKKLLTPAISQTLLIGLLDDSYVFKTQQSGISALHVTLALIAAGADFNKAKAAVANHKSPTVVKLWASILAQGEIVAQGKLFVMAVDEAKCQREGIDLAELDGIVNFAATLINCDVVAFVREVAKDEIKVSLRSKKTNVKNLAAQFNGGGHQFAAGFATNGAVTKVIDRLIALLK